MNFEFQLNYNDYEEHRREDFKKTSESEGSEKRTIYKWVLLIGLFFFLMGMLSQENGFLVVGVILLSMPIFCKIFVQTGVEEIYEIYDVQSDIGVDRQREMPSIANSANCGPPMTLEVIGEGLVLNTPTWQGTFKWENFKFFTETISLLVIYPVPSLYPVPKSTFIIPKRAFSGEEQLWDFLQLLHHKLGKRRYNYLKKMPTKFFNLKSKI
ncbi:hypothetical protein Q5692_16775 [Microcoleus sp. C2C3]|uniref:hypothetical protein n=1 Tax=unclassified Microcoleus TaxID=2642155 RepID=UPI002FD27BF1